MPNVYGPPEDWFATTLELSKAIIPLACEAANRAATATPASILIDFEVLINTMFFPFCSVTTVGLPGYACPIIRIMTRWLFPSTIILLFFGRAPSGSQAFVMPHFSCG
jgi:hypothetical protein